MRLRVEPGGVLTGATKVSGDKSIAHRWMILAATASGRSVLRGLPFAQDVRSTAHCLAGVAPHVSEALLGWANGASAQGKSESFTWDDFTGGGFPSELIVEGQGWEGLATAPQDLDCANSGTSMRLLSGVLAACDFETTLVGDASLSARPMERVAVPLRLMGASVETTDGHAPIRIRGGRLRGITYELPVASSQIKSAILLAGLTADGETSVVARASGRDHTERALLALGAPVTITEDQVGISAFQHDGFEGDVPGDPSSAAFILAAAAISGSNIAVRDVGLNPSRIGFIDVMRRMGVHVRMKERWEALDEPAGILEIEAGEGPRSVTVEAGELVEVIDEVPVLAALASHAKGESRFEGAGELRIKESDRLEQIVRGIRGLGGEASVEGETLIIAGGGLAGGTADAGGDHRIAMAMAVAAMGARGDCFIDGMECADVSFPGFTDCLIGLGAPAEPV